MIGHRLLDIWETTAMRALITFCSQHPLEVLLSAFGLFPAHDPADPLWLDRMANVWPQLQLSIPSMLCG